MVSWWVQVREVHYELVYALITGNDLIEQLAAVNFFVEVLQFLAFIWHPSIQGWKQFDEPSIMINFLLPWHSDLAVWILLGVLTFLLMALGLLCYEISFQGGITSFRLLNTSRWMVGVLSSVGFFPVLKKLLQPLSDFRSDNLAQIVVILVILPLYYVANAFIYALWFDPNPLVVNPFHLTTSRVQFLNMLVKTAVALAFILVPTPILSTFILFLAMLVGFLLALIYPSFTHPLTNLVQAGFAGALFYGSIETLIVDVQYTLYGIEANEAKRVAMHVGMVISMIVAAIALHVRHLLLLPWTHTWMDEVRVLKASLKHLNSANTPSISHSMHSKPVEVDVPVAEQDKRLYQQLSSNLDLALQKCYFASDVDYLARFLLIRNVTLFGPLILQLLGRALDLKFPKSEMLLAKLLLYLSYLQCVKPHLARKQSRRLIKRIRSMSPFQDTLFVVFFAHRHWQHQTSQVETGEDESLDALAFLTYLNNFKRATSEQAKALQASIQFWQAAAEHGRDRQLLVHYAMIRQRHETNSAWYYQILFKRFPKSVVVLRSYASLIDAVVTNKKFAETLLSLADGLEEEAAKYTEKAHQNAMLYENIGKDEQQLRLPKIHLTADATTIAIREIPEEDNENCDAVAQETSNVANLQELRKQSVAESLRNEPSLYNESMLLMSPPSHGRDQQADHRQRITAAATSNNFDAPSSPQLSESSKTSHSTAHDDEGLQQLDLLGNLYESSIAARHNKTATRTIQRLRMGIYMSLSILLLGLFIVFIVGRFVFLSLSYNEANLQGTQRCAMLLREIEYAMLNNSTDLSTLIQNNRLELLSLAAALEVTIQTTQTSGLLNKKSINNIWYNTSYVPIRIYFPPDIYETGTDSVGGSMRTFVDSVYDLSSHLNDFNSVTDLVQDRDYRFIVDNSVRNDWMVAQIQLVEMCDTENSNDVDSRRVNVIAMIVIANIIPFLITAGLFIPSLRQLRRDMFLSGKLLTKLTVIISQEQVLRFQSSSQKEAANGGNSSLAGSQTASRRNSILLTTMNVASLPNGEATGASSITNKQASIGSGGHNSDSEGTATTNDILQENDGTDAFSTGKEARTFNIKYISTTFVAAMLVLSLLSMIFMAALLIQNDGSLSDSLKLSLSDKRRVWGVRVSAMASEIIRYDNGTWPDTSRDVLREYLQESITELLSAHAMVTQGNETIGLPSVDLDPQEASQHLIVYGMSCSDVTNMECWSMDQVIKYYVREAQSFLLVPDNELSYTLPVYQNMVWLLTQRLQPLLDLSVENFKSNQNPWIAIATYICNVVICIAVLLFFVMLTMLQFPLASLEEHVCAIRNVLFTLPKDFIIQVPMIRDYLYRGQLLTKHEIWAQAQANEAALKKQRNDDEIEANEEAKAEQAEKDEKEREKQKSVRWNRLFEKQQPSAE